MSETPPFDPSDFSEPTPSADVPPLGEPHPDGDRLQKVMARMGIGSRRVNEDLIAERRVTVNGEVAVLGRRVHIETDEIAVDGAVFSSMPDSVTYLLNKPAKVITSASDPEGRSTVIQLVPEEPRVFSVGRLDYDTEGLLLLTNDGTMSHRLTHPSFGIEKEYLAHVSGQPSRQVLRQLREGVELDDGMTSPADVVAVSPDLVKITIHEGRNRQVRRMFEAVGHDVLRLVRTRIGPVADTNLKPGEWRELSRDEVLDLQRAVSVR